MPLLRTLLVVCLVATGTACDIQVSKQGDVAVGVASGKASDEWQRTYSLPKGGRFEIINVNGKIEISPASGSQVEVWAYRELRTQSEEEAKARLAKVQMIEDVGPDRVRIEAKPDDQGVNFGSHGRVSKERLSIEYRVKVPAGLVTSFRTENGPMRFENIEGRITLASTNGPIIGRGLSGAVDASTVNGGIEIGLTSVSGESKLATVNGPATLIVSPEISADIEAAAINGGVFTQDGLPLTTSDRTNKRVTGRINDGGPRITVQTTNGGVRVGMTDDFARGRGGMRARRRAEAGG